MTKGKMRTLFKAVAAIALFSSIAFGQEAAAVSVTINFSGSVVDETNLPLVGATVSYVRIADVKADAMGRPKFIGPLINATVITDGSGTFSATGLPAGTYALCASGTLAAHLTSCQWKGGYVQARVAAGQSATGLRLTVPTGTIVNINVQDPDSKIVLARNPLIGGGGQNFVVGVISGAGYYSRAQLISRTATSLLYGVAIPKDTNVKLIVSTTLKVTDLTGQQVAIGSPSVAVSPALQDLVSVGIVVH